MWIKVLLGFAFLALVYYSGSHEGYRVGVADTHVEGVKLIREGCVPPELEYWDVRGLRP